MGETKELPKSHGKQVEVSELKPRIQGLYHHLPHFSQAPVLVVLIHQTIFNGQTSALVMKHSPWMQTGMMSQSPLKHLFKMMQSWLSLKNCFVILCGSSQALGQFPPRSCFWGQDPCRGRDIELFSFPLPCEWWQGHQGQRHWSHSWQLLLGQPYHPLPWAGQLSPHQLSGALFSYNWVKRWSQLESSSVICMTLTVPLLSTLSFSIIQTRL